jgi:hypothetical protein
MDHILTPWAIIEEVRHRSLKFFCCFVDFWKAFDSIPWEAMFQMLGDNGVLEMLIDAIMQLYETILVHLRTTHGLSNFIKSTIEVKQGLAHVIQDLYRCLLALHLRIYRDSCSLLQYFATFES